MKYVDLVREKFGQTLSAIAIVLGAGTCALASASEALPPSSGYDLIPKKNVFKLRDPAPPALVAPTNPPLPKVFLTGISTMLNQKLAFLRLPGTAKAGIPAAEQSLMLAEGQRAGDLEVLEVDPAGGRVKIRQSGEIVDLTFEKDGLKSNPPANLEGQPQPLANPPLPQTGQSAMQNPAAPEPQDPAGSMMPQNPAAAAPMPALPKLPTAHNRLNRQLPSRGL